MRHLSLLILAPLLMACETVSNLDSRVTEAHVARGRTPCEIAPRLNAEAASGYGILPPRPQPMSSYGRRGVRVIGSTLPEEILVRDVAAARNPDGTAEVSVTFESCGFIPVRVAPVVYFLDTRGQVMEAQAALPVDVPPGTSSQGMRQRSVGRPATFFIEVRDAPG